MKQKHSIFFIFAGIVLTIILFFTSCNDEKSPEPNVPNLRALSAGEQEIIRSANNFSFDLFSRISTEHPDENIFISPFSISTALSMTLNGAEGETLEAMKKALHVEDMSEEEINKAYKELVNFLLQLDKTVNLEIANSNWYRDDLTINESFESVLLDYYDAEVKATDFTDPVTLNRINGWIENKTNGKIQNMLDQIPADILMYLINAIYFKADWQYQFDKNETADQEFYLADGSYRNVPTMFSEGVKVAYATDENVEFIDIPYGNGQYSFTILLPGPEADINQIAAGLSAPKLAALEADTSHITTKLYLPKFKLEFKVLLNEVLSSMGMEVAFTDNARFGKLFANDVNAKISRVLHQSFLEVNEEGSEAAAATIVEIDLTSVGPPTALRINRPFMFFIREKHSQTILFSGKMMDPK